MEKEDTYAAHSDYFGNVYKKSLLEAMGSTGVILPEFRPPLDDLRDRLGVSEWSTKALFLEAVKSKMVPKVEWVVSELERTQLTQQQLSKRRGKDMGEDLFQTGKGADVSGSKTKCKELGVICVNNRSSISHAKIWFFSISNICDRASLDLVRT